MELNLYVFPKERKNNNYYLVLSYCPYTGLAAATTLVASIERVVDACLRDRDCLLLHDLMNCHSIVLERSTPQQNTFKAKLMIFHRLSLLKRTSPILSNSSIKTTPLSVRTIAPASSRLSPVSWSEVTAAAVSPTPEEPLPVVEIAKGERREAAGFWQFSGWVAYQ